MCPLAGLAPEDLQRGLRVPPLPTRGAQLHTRSGCLGAGSSPRDLGPDTDPRCPSVFPSESGEMPNLWTGLLSPSDVWESAWAGAHVQMWKLGRILPSADTSAGPPSLLPRVPRPALQCLVIARSVPSKARASPARLLYHSPHPKRFSPIPAIISSTLNVQPRLP